jgi:hypothetical protein
MPDLPMFTRLFKQLQVRHRRQTSGQRRVVITTIRSATITCRRSNWLGNEMPAFLAEFPYSAMRLLRDFHETTRKHRTFQAVVTEP